MNQALTAVSLFTGAGGMDIGFEKAGVNVIFANELMKEAAETYKANHPGRTIVNDDINNVIEKMNNYEGTDLVFGGPPCQGFSVAGKMDPDDARSKLIFTFLDVVERVKPRAFVMENVKALGFLDKWEPVRKKYLERASRLGYHCSPFILNATEYGVSQKRERVFFIGIKNNQDVFFEYHMNDLLEQQKTEAPTIRALLKSLGPAGTEKNPNTCTAKITFATNPIMRKSPYSGMYFNGQGRPINIDERDNLVKLLKERNIATIDKLIITHPHADHLGGAYAVFKNFEVKEVYDNGDPTTTQTYKTYLKNIKEKKIKYQQLSANDELDFGSGVKFKVFSPTKQMLKSGDDLNNNSLVGQLKYNDFTMMFTGDAEKCIAPFYISHIIREE